jgi:hypothetical protein
VGSAGTCPTCKKCQGTDCVADNSQVPPQTPNNCKKELCQGGAVTSQNDDADHDQNTCCFNGNSLQKFDNDLQTLQSQCPSRTQNDTRLHEIDGCSVPAILAVLTPGLSVQDPTGGLFGLASTAFGAPQGSIASAGAALNLPCNQHDICYQTCGSTQGTCDTGMHNGMNAVCNAAYPTSTCPYSGLEILKCPFYFTERSDCFQLSDLYKFGLDQFGSSAWEERQTQYCKCCP